MEGKLRGCAASVDADIVAQEMIGHTRDGDPDGLLSALLPMLRPEGALR
jgi:hypothetical protein